MSLPYRALGKEVLRNGAHFTDACDPDGAALIAAALNNYGPAYTAAIARLEPATHGTPRREGDEYVCTICRRRWDASEGEEAHP